MPLINLKDEEFFVRNDKNGQITLFLIRSQQQIFLNQVGAVVFNLCREVDDYKEIVDKIAKQYKSTSHELITNDVKAIINVFQVYGLILVGLEEVKANHSICFVGDLHYLITSKFISTNFDNEESFLLPNAFDDYSPLSLRSKTMTNREYYINHYSEGKIDFVLIIVPPVNAVSASVIVVKGFVTTIQEYSRKKLVFLELLNYLKSNIGVNVTKIRVNLIQDDVENSELSKTIEFLLMGGFELESVLRNEIGFQNLNMYSKHVV